MLDNQILTQGQRLKKFREHLGITQSNMADTLEIEQPYLAQMESNKRNISHSTINIIAKCYNKLSLNWLFTGDGSMLITRTSEVTPLTGGRTKVLHLPNATAWAGDVIHIDGQLDSVEEWLMPALGVGGDTLYSFRVQGVSMEPTLRGGDLLLCSPPLTQLNELEGGALYVVVYVEGVRAKRLYRAADGKGVVLRSDNPLYQDTTVAEGAFAALRVRFRISDMRDHF